MQLTVTLALCLLCIDPHVHARSSQMVAGQLAKLQWCAWAAVSCLTACQDCLVQIDTWLSVCMDNTWQLILLQCGGCIQHYQSSAARRLASHVHSSGLIEMMQIDTQAPAS
jgi:hypothetical protein